MILPFVFLLLAIAVMPFISPHWWEKQYAAVSVVLGAVTVVYYVVVLKNSAAVVHMLHEYAGFIALIGSLYVVSGGIHVRVKGEAKPAANVLFLLAGAVLSNVIGTTGASMLLIRPWIRMNKYRITSFHIVFFIFIISNVSGCLTPIGDPPLFLGYLKGIPFWWTLHHLWLPWLSMLLLLVGSFYCFDMQNFKKAPAQVREMETEHKEWGVDGLHNVLFIGLILWTVFLDSPWREAGMLGAAAGSWFSTRKQVHESNHFDFAPVREVGFLFAGIFTTMLPALEYLNNHAGGFGDYGPLHYYFGCGLLSSVLDNAPTYLAFLTASFGLFVDQEVVRQVQHLLATHGQNIGQLAGVHAVEVRNTYLTLLKYHGDLVASGDVPLDTIETAFLIGNHNLYIIAISMGAVFFGAMTYIGNGPNFMVRSIAVQAKVHVPGFFGYICKYALPVLLPALLLVGFMYLKWLPQLVR